MKCIYDASSPFMKARLRVLDRQTLTDFPLLTRVYRDGTGRYQTLFKCLDKRLKNLVGYWLVNPHSPELWGIMRHITTISEIWHHLHTSYVHPTYKPTLGLGLVSSPQLRDVGQHYMLYTEKHDSHRDQCQIDLIAGLRRGELPSVHPSEHLIESFVLYGHVFLKAARDVQKRLGMSAFPPDEAASRLVCVIRMHLKSIRRDGFIRQVTTGYETRDARIHRRAQRRQITPDDE